MDRTPRVALSIAGSDPSGGAGIQADLKTFAALEVFGAAVVAGLTAQNTREVRATHVPSAAFLAQQIDCVFEDLDIAATKLGMLANAELIAITAERLRSHRARYVVLDPVMVAKSGARLLAADAVEALRRLLAPQAAVLTPNVPEAAAMLGTSEGDVLVAPERACRALLELGCGAVVLKGGHAGGSSSDDLYQDRDQFARLPARRTISANTHGTGCTFSAAIAAFLARGAPPLEAAQRAKRYVTAAIEGSRAWKLGHGHGPVHHFHAWWPSALREPRGGAE
jgi:hydroxymethylpyrimidine/phosphomethylpyrimidine kinase